LHYLPKLALWFDWARHLYPELVEGFAITLIGIKNPPTDRWRTLI